MIWSNSLSTHHNNNNNKTKTKICNAFQICNKSMANWISDIFLANSSPISMTFDLAWFMSCFSKANWKQRSFFCYISLEMYKCVEDTLHHRICFFMIKFEIQVFILKTMKQKFKFTNVSYYVVRKKRYLFAVSIKRCLGWGFFDSCIYGYVRCAIM